MNMNEKKDRTILIVSIIVIVGVLVSLIGACVVGGAVGYVVARRQVKAVNEQRELLEPGERFNPPRFLPEEEAPSPLPPELPEGLLPFPMRPGEQLSGAWIREVVPDTPADQAGLQEGDLIVAVDGQQVDDEHPLQELIGEHEPGDGVEITYRRGEEENTVKVRLGKNPEEPQRAYLGVYFVSLSTLPNRFQVPGD